jgi:acyl-CoA thioester hydrolase
MAQTYTTGIEVRFSDLDAYGHVNSAVYFTYLETARVKLFREQFEALMRQGIFLLVVRAECDFKIPIMLGDEVVVTLWLAKAGRASFELEYRLHDGKETTYATARTTMVSFDSVSKSTLPLPESIRAMA